MNVLLILIAVSLGVAGAFLGCFVWAVKSGQFEDTCTPSMRVLADDATQLNRTSNSSSETNRDRL